jgi:uncharacterized protein YjdB
MSAILINARRILRTAVLRTAVLPTAALLMLGVTGSCTENTVEPDLVASMQLTPPTSTVRAGATVTLVARPLDANGALVSVRSVTWSSSNTAVATVSSAGVVTTLAPGDARIAASAFGKSATATVTVTAREVASVVVTPPTVSVRVGSTVPLQAQTLDAEGGVLTGRPVTWSSSNTSVATVNAQGVVTGVATGAATITATSSGRSGQAAVTVTLPPVQTVVVSPARDTIGVGTQRALSAVLRDAAGNVLTGRALAWSSSNVGVASVSSTGVVIGLAPGSTTISATSEGRVGTAVVVVLERLASVVILTPGSGTLVVGTTQALTAQVTDAQGNLLTNRPITYSSDAPSVASVNATGVVSALAPGTARITATSEGRIGTATFQVIPVPVAAVQITPSAPVLVPGGTTQLTAVARSAAGTVLTGRQVTWLSGAPSVVTVSAGGLVSAVGPGTALVLATIDGVTASITVTVNLPTIASISLTPPTPEITILGSVQLVATPLNAAGTPLTGRTITWSSADESIAFVSSSGLVVGFRLGTVRITATSEGVSASTVVTVR